MSELFMDEKSGSEGESEIKSQISGGWKGHQQGNKILNV